LDERPERSHGTAIFRLAQDFAPHFPSNSQTRGRKVPMSARQARIVHISIERNWRDVYDFAAKPENMALWASGLGSGLEADGENWVAHGPLGSVRVKFAPENDFGVMDHIVTMASGLEVHNALRVVPNGDGAEVMFTLLRLPDVSEEQFEADFRWVLKDLNTLKKHLET
jgi:hypothetical protein